MKHANLDKLNLQTYWTNAPKILFGILLKLKQTLSNSTYTNNAFKCYLITPDIRDWVCEFELMLL